MTAHQPIEPATLVDVTSAMIALNIGKIERYPGHNFTVVLMDGSYGQGKSAGEAFEKAQQGLAA